MGQRDPGTRKARESLSMEVPGDLEQPSGASWSPRQSGWLEVRARFGFGDRSVGDLRSVHESVSVREAAGRRRPVG